MTAWIIPASSDNSTFNTKAKMQSIVFVGRRCYIVPVCLYSPRSSNPLNESSLKSRRAAAGVASTVFFLTALWSSGAQTRWEREQEKGRALSLNRHWIRLEWIADVLCNYTHIEPFRVDLSYFKLHWPGPPYWLKAASIYLNNNVEISKNSLDHNKKTDN